MKKTIGTLLLIVGLALTALDILHLYQGLQWFPSILFGAFLIIAGWAVINKDGLKEVIDDIISVFIQVK